MATSPVVKIFMAAVMVQMTLLYGRRAAHIRSPCRPTISTGLSCL